MKKFGLIGYPLSHTFSPSYFAEKFKQLELIDHSYKAYPIASVEGFRHLSLDHFVGMNVTIPYKESIMDFLNHIDPQAEEIAAVNTIHFTPDGLKGYNTDIDGFKDSVEPLLGDIKKALILGTGGASKAVSHALKLLGVDVLFVSRSKDKLQYRDLDETIIAEHRLIVNTTPLGMSPLHKQQPKIPYQFIGADHLCYDLIYNPEKTLFLKSAQAQGARIKNGLQMLEIQAEKSWEIWREQA